MPNVRTRIAPSPTGMPHVGTVFQGLINYVYAKRFQGKFIIRIEDTDQSRLVKEAETSIIQAFDWFGIPPDESPIHGGDYGPYRQSERLEIYQKYAEELIKKNHAYYCFCSPDRLDGVRKDMQKQGKPPMYDKHCRGLEPESSLKRIKSEPYVIRMKIPPDQTISITDKIRGQISFESDTVDDQVILKSDGFPTYHLAVVVDDHLMKITHMVRGEEWISSAPKHILLYQYFGWQMPKIIHTPLLRNPDRSKLGKRHGHASVSWYQEQGYLPEAVINFLASRVWNHPQGQEIYDLDELTKHFDFKDMHIQGPIVDLDKLDWYNGQWLRRLPDKVIKQRLKHYASTKLDDALLNQIWPHIKERLVRLSQIDELTQYFHTPPKPNNKLILKQSRLSDREVVQYLQKVIQLLQTQDKWRATQLESVLRDLQQSLSLKPKAAFMTLRVVLTGQTATPPLFDVMEILGKKESLNRLESASRML